MQPHTNNHTNPSIATDDITDVDSDSDILSGSDEVVDDIRDIDSNPDILSGPEEEEGSDIASFNEDDMYGSDNEDNVIVFKLIKVLLSVKDRTTEEEKNYRTRYIAISECSK